MNTPKRLFSERTKRYLSGLLIFAILFGQTVQIPILNTTRAAETEYPNLVAILVNEGSFSGDLKSKLARYGEDVQANLPGSRASIVSIPDDTTPEKIAALLEKLYYEGDGNGASRLVGAVLVGELPMPVVHRSEKTFLSVFPYVDFVDKSFVYKSDKGYYEYSDIAGASDVPEIWHGIVRSNTGDSEKDQERLEAFFDKTHEYYQKTGRFEASKFRQEPHVFYFDSYHDQLSSQVSEWKSYQLMLKYAEELSYNRFSKHLAKSVYEAYQSYLGNDVPDAAGTEIGAILAANTGSTLNFDSAPDIQTREPIEKSLKRFFEVLSAKYLGDILRYVHNAGRYGTGNDVRVDVPAIVVGKSDELMKRTLKDADTALEDAIDALVKGGLARHVAVGLTYKIDDSSATAGTAATETAAAVPGTTSSSSRTYRNYLFGKEGSAINSANECTIVRGSSLAVEANRGYDVTNSQADVALLQSDLPNGRCFPGNAPAAMTFWGNNSPLKLDVSRSNEGIMTLIGNAYGGYIKPTFDMGGAKEIKINPSTGKNEKGLSVASPNDCTVKAPWISDPFKSESEIGGSTGFPSERPGQPITCITDVASNTVTPETFETYYSNGFSDSESCVTHRLVLDGVEVRRDGSWCDAADGSYTHIDKTYSFKKVLSVIEHKSPTDKEYGEELKNFLTPSLPADKDRYVDFISAKGNYKKISYPNLFRISFPEDEDLTPETAQAKIKEVLDAKSAEINALIASEAPSGGVYEVLKNGAYPSSAKIDLFGILQSKPEMLQAATDAVVWNNLANATAKYAYVLEHHLDIDGNASYPIAGHKKDYEISYVVGKGDARNMYVKLDPASKEGPGAEVADILKKSAEQLAMIDASNIASGTAGEKAEFKCGPPDGVPLPQWLPAIFCWLGSILPPTISAGNCSPNSSIDIAALITKHFGGDKNGNGIPDYQEDLNANGIMDGAEYVKDGTIRLSATPKRAPYRESVALSAILENKEGVQVYVDSLSEVSFDVTRVVAYSGGVAVEKYRRGASGELGNSVTVKDYVNFGQITVRAKEGKATYVLTTKDRDADVYFDATVSPRDKDGKAAFVKTSGEAKLEIRSEALKIGLTASGSSISSYVNAGEFSELSFPIRKVGKGGTELPLAMPVTVRITDDDTGKSVADPVITNKDVWTYTGTLLKQSGNYRFEFADKEGVMGSQVLTVTAGAAVKVELSPSSSLFVKNETVTVLAKIVDQFGNYAKGDLVELSAKIGGGGYFLENKSDVLNKAIVDGFTTFEVSTSDGGKNLTFELEVKNRNLKASTSFRSLDYAKAVIDVENRDKIVVGKEPHAVKFKVVDELGKTLEGFHGVAAVDFPKLSGELDTNFVAIKDGLSSTGILLTPKYVAAKDLKLDVRIPGVRDVEGNVLTVYPDVPMRVALETEKSAIEARTGETESVTAKLFDRYGNLAYNHADGLSAKFSIPEDFRKNLRFPGKTYAAESKFDKGVATVSVVSTRLPGTPYVIVEVTPGLEQNSYVVTDPSGKSVTISGYSKNAVAVDTYYLWNKEKLAKIQYNGLYTVLAGGDFGNFTEKDYLAGEVLFNPDSRSMAVTALVNDATDRSKTFSVTPGGKVELPSGDSLVTAEVSTVAGRTSVGFYDPFYKEYVARAYFNFAEGSERVACKNDGNSGIDNCEVPAGSAFSVLKGYGDATAVSQNGLALVLRGSRILEVDANGAVSALPNVRLVVDKDNTKNLFAVKVLADNKEVGYFAAKLRADSVVLTKPSDLSANLSANPGKVVVEAVSSRYSSLPTFLGNSSRGAKGLAFYSSRDADGTNADRQLVGGPDKAGFEEYREKQGIGWEGQNKTLLQFAGGSSVGEATRFNMSFSTVNLGDPVFRVKKATNEGAYDRTIGTELFDAVGETIESYKKFDFNGDGYDDLVVFFESGKIRLLANLKGSFRDMGYLAYLADAGLARKAVGDFAGDRYSDIVAVTKQGQLILLDNVEGKFVRKQAIVVDDRDSVTTLRGKVVQLESFDMDGDGKTDLVVSDESGELNILYGKVLNGQTVFTKKILDTDLALRLSAAERSDGGAVYFDGLPQLKNPTEPNQAKYLEESKALAAAGDEGGIPPEVQAAAIDSKLYYVHAYSVPVEYTGGTLSSQLESRLAAGIGNDPENPNSPNTALQNEVLKAMNDSASMSASGSFVTSGTYTETRYKTFLRSDFAVDRDVRVVKTMRDVNSDPLKSEDPVEITLTLGNSGSTTLKNVAYLDSFDRAIFTETDAPRYEIDAPSLHQSGALVTLTSGTYDFLFDGFDLRPGETATIKYVLKTRAVSFGKFVVGKLDAADPSGDVAMRANNVCGEAMTLWRSVKPGPRDYEKTTQTFQSDQSDGGGIAGKFIDSNANGQPDYIDVLSAEVSSADLQDMKKYYYHLNGGGTAYDASKHGILLFREIVDPTTGTVNSGNVEIARLVANGEKNHLQRSAEPGDGDATVTVASDAVNATYDDSTKTLKAGSQSGTGGSLPVCGTNGYKTVIAPQVIGWKQVTNVPNGQLDVYFGPGKHSKDGGKTSVDCGMTFSSSSKPTWAGGRVIGEGWKIVTKHTYNAYVMAAKTADYRESESNVPDDYDQRGKDLFSYDFGTNTVSLDGLTSGNVEAIEAGIDEIVHGLGCGFGGGACISMPFNWAPLAPGSSPTVMGFPTSSLVPSTGFPVFSALTGMPVGPFCIPSVWPVSPLDLGKYCGGLGAGWYLGDKSPTNFFRFYITPTLTGAVGIAACFGPVAAVMGRVPPQGVSPVVPGGNCIVAAKPLLGCKDDGSDGDVASQGMANADGFFNANSCKPKTNLRPLMNTERQLIRSYVRGSRDKTVVNGITAALPYVTSGPKGFGSSPVVGIGLASGQDPNFEVGVNTDALKNFDFGNILKINLSRTSAFPEFIMDWVNRQTEEVVNKLTSLPTLYIILPDFSKIYESGWNGFADKLKKKYDGGVSDYGKDRDFKVGTSKYAPGATNTANSLLADNKDNINTVGKNISGLRTAYEFLSSLPIIQFENEMVRVDVPMISDEDVDKAILDFNKTKAQWAKEISDKKQAWSKLGSKDGINEKVFVEAEATVASIDAWARFLEDAKRFPDKLYRYMTWKQRYAEQILCNVESIEQMTGGYIAENGKRFRAWVELYVMLKAIMKSWQLMVDLFYQHTSDCGVCRNERYDLKHFIFKIISAVIPKIPIIKFPKWPDIVLDLHNIRLGLRILMPEFEFHVSPFVLPHLPRLALPNVPGLGIGLPTIPAPPTFPKLPDLPDLPSLPSIKLPDLPPPPKIPKLFAAIQGVLQILKLVSKILCILRKNPFVPEWRAGDQIAQITERQGKLPIDFFNIEFPNFSLAFVDAIRVTTFVNVEFQVDFILEMAKSTFQPINEFSTDLRSAVSGAGKEIGLPSKIDMTDTVPQGDTRIDVKGPQGMKVPDVTKMSTAERKALMTNFAWTIALSFREFVVYLDREKGNDVALAEFKKLVAAEASKLVGSDDRLVAGIGDVLARAAHYDASEERALTDSLIQDNKEKFGIVKDSIRAEIEEAKAMKAKIEKFQRERGSAGNLLSSIGKNTSDAVFATTFQNAGTSFADRGKALEKFEANSAEKFEKLASKEDAVPSELETMGADVVGQVKAMTDETLRKEKSLASTTANPLTLLGGIDDGSDGLYENGQPFRFDADDEQMKLAASSASEASSAMNLQFVYQGIYVKDEGKQSRLFDYTEELQGGEEALLVDTAKAGAGKEDVVYAMGSSLYLKRNLKSDVSSHSTDRVKSYDMDEILSDNRDPSAPNYFKEDFVSSNQINFSFDPAKSTDRKFRLEFYDYVDRFDRIARSEEAPVTPKRAVDLFADMRDDTVVDATGTGMVVRKNAAYFDAASGEAELTYPGYRTLTENDTIGVAGGRTVHTDGGGAKIRFAESGQELADGTVVDVPEYGNVEFLATGTFKVESGNVYLFDSDPQTKTADLSSIKGLPVLPGTKIVLAKPASRITVGYHDGSEYGLRGPAEYGVHDLGKPAPKYSVSVSQSNDWYYSKLYAFDGKTVGAQASLTLLSPQIQADKEGPLNGFPTNYRIPVYVKETVSLKKYVSDVSGVSDAYVDVDPSSDRDGDKIADNDRDSDSASTGSGIVKGSDWSELVIGPFTAPGAFTARMVAVDANGNKTFRDVTFTAYAPTPKIVAASAAQANGSIDAQYSGEPIDLFRYRGGKLSRLTGTGETLTDAIGNFTRSFSGGADVAITHSGKTVATVMEKTGRIDLKDSSYSVSVRAAGSAEPMVISVRDKNGADVYFESFALPATTRIASVTQLSDANETGVFVRTESGIDFVRNAQDAKSLPGGAFLVNENRKPFAGIGRDGNVYLLENGYSLSYRNVSDYPVVSVKNSFGVVVSEILFRLDAEYVIK